MYFKIVITFLALSTSVYAQVTSSGECPSYSGVENFDLQKFLGTWYVHAAYPNTVTTGDCVKVDYSAYGNGSFNDYIAQIVDGQITYLAGNFKQTEEGGATVAGDLNGLGSGETITVTTTIVKIDYRGYIIFYSCDQISENEKSDVVWILSRQTSLSESLQAAVNQYIATNEYINPDNLVLANYESCGF